jgi:Zn-dependent protease
MEVAMFPNFRLGTLFGFPIKANLSFLLLLGVVFVWTGGAQGLAVALITAASVLLHELGHALTARRLGVPVSAIELHFFGGAAQITGLPRTPADEMLIAGAGPAVSFALAGIGHTVALISGALAGTVATPALELFALINVVLGAFNLLPAFPSDGGRILRAWLARRRGLLAATEAAVKVGRVVCLALVGLGLFAGSLQLVLVAGVLWMMGSRERLATRLRGADPFGAWEGRAAGPPSAGVAHAEYFPPATATRPWTAPVVPGDPGASPRNGRVVVRVWRF